MNAADTNILVRIITGDDDRQTEAADRFIEQGAWVSLLAVAETMWVLRTGFRSSAAEIASAVEMLLSHRDLVLQDSDAVAAALNLFRTRPSLGFSDCLMLELARKAGHLPLGTFDRGLGRVEGAKLVGLR
jgi:predicted nucleic-acid-binding protein